VGVVVWRDEEVLLVRRGGEPNRGQWSIPGGAQELGETVYAAAEREVMEETGLGIRILGLIDVVDGIRRDEEGRVSWHYTLIDLAAEWSGGDARAGDDAEAVGWFSLKDLPGLGLWDETERIIRQSAKLRGMPAVTRPPGSPL
jgi:ADP-ribose pyrophosphatase YjhB (NUDIX family)